MTSTLLNRPEEGWLSLRSRPITRLRPIGDFSQIRADPNSSLFLESLIDVRNARVAGRNYYNSAWTPPYYHAAPGSIPGLYVRTSVAKKLQAVNERLHGIGLELFVMDAYRPVALQNYFFFDWLPAFLLKLWPEKGEQWAREETGKYWSAGSTDPKRIRLCPPLHGSGGAVDLTIRPIDGFPLEMGSLFDDPSDRSRPDYFEDHRPLNFTEREACQNRRILFHVMVEEGFVAHQLEWWHFSFGDRLWAAATGNTPIYGYANLEKIMHERWEQGRPAGAQCCAPISMAARLWIVCEGGFPGVLRFHRNCRRATRLAAFRRVSGSLS